MALLKCKECGAEVSDDALVCPKCGSSMLVQRISILGWMKKNPKTVRTIIIVVIILIGLSDMISRLLKF